MSNDQKIVSISTIPLTKLTIVMNNFIANTITHLNKLSVKGDEKLAEFDNKLNDLDAMTTLLEAKLNSLPENITSTYPPLQEVQLDDVNPVIIPNPVASVSQDNSNSNTNSNTAVVSGSGGSVPVPPPPPPPPVHGANNTVPNPPQPPTNPEPVPVQEQQEGEAENLTPEQELDNFLKEHSNFANIYKSMKLGVPTMQLEMKVEMQGFDIDLYHELVEKAKKVNPNIK